VSTEFCTEVMVAIDACELDLAGLPGRTVNVGAGEGCEGGTMIGEAFGKDGESLAAGVGNEVDWDGDAAEIVVEIFGWL